MSTSSNTDRAFGNDPAKVDAFIAERRKQAEAASRATAKIDQAFSNEPGAVDAFVASRGQAPAGPAPEGSTRTAEQQRRAVADLLATPEARRAYEKTKAQANVKAAPPAPLPMPRPATAHDREGALAAARCETGSIVAADISRLAGLPAPSLSPTEHASWIFTNEQGLHVAAFHPTADAKGKWDQALYDARRVRYRESLAVTDEDRRADEATKKAPAARPAK